jgi:hypothetical protein
VTNKPPHTDKPPDYWDQVSHDYARWLKEGHDGETFDEWRARVAKLKETSKP